MCRLLARVSPSSTRRSFLKKWSVYGESSRFLWFSLHGTLLNHQFYTDISIFFPSHHYLQLRKLKWWALVEKLVWVCPWKSQICCSYRYFQVSFCNPPRIWCCKCDSISRIRGNIGRIQTALHVYIMWVPLGLERGCSHSGNYQCRRQGKAAYP